MGSPLVRRNAWAAANSWLLLSLPQARPLPPLVLLLPGPCWPPRSSFFWASCRCQGEAMRIGLVNVA